MTGSAAEPVWGVEGHEPRLRVCVRALRQGAVNESASELPDDRGQPIRRVVSGSGDDPALGVAAADDACELGDDLSLVRCRCRRLQREAFEAGALLAEGGFHDDPVGCEHAETDQFADGATAAAITHAVSMCTGFFGRDGAGAAAELVRRPQGDHAMPRVGTAAEAAVHEPPQDQVHLLSQPHRRLMLRSDGEATFQAVLDEAGAAERA